MKLYIYENETSELIAEFVGETNQECEEKAFEYLDTDDFYATYTKQQPNVKKMTNSEMIEKLNSYKGGDIWNDIIWAFGSVDEDKTEEIGTSDTIVFENGSQISYSVQEKTWKITKELDSNETLYTASDSICSECCVGTRDEWKYGNMDSFKQWHSEKIQKEEIDAETTLDEWIESTLDGSLREADEDQIAEYTRLDKVDSNMKCGYYKADTVRGVYFYDAFLDEPETEVTEPDLFLKMLNNLDDGQEITTFLDRRSEEIYNKIFEEYGIEN